MKLNAKELRRVFEPLSRSDRYELMTELWPKVRDRLNENRLTVPAIFQQEATYIRSKALRTGKCNWRNLSKLYLIAEVTDIRELNNWCIQGNKFFRKKNFHVRKGYTHIHRPRLGTRRPSITGWSGETVPRTFIDKHLPKWVKTQREYDLFMAEKTGMTQEKYKQKMGIK